VYWVPPPPPAQIASEEDVPSGSRFGAMKTYTIPALTIGCQNFLIVCCAECVWIYIDAWNGIMGTRSSAAGRRALALARDAASVKFHSTTQLDRGHSGCSAPAELMVEVA